MARQERPVDPTAGPVQALAYELRKLRAEAGNPTYRTLARTAGYSATTLSEAAGGTRLPTLEVLLAYIGACGGDPEEWRRRWHEAADEHRVADTGNADPTDGGPDEDGPTPRRWRPGLLVAVAATAVVVTVATAVGVARRDDPPAAAPSAGPPACPTVPTEVAFTGTTYGSGAHVRRGATRDEPVLTTVPPGCTVGFAGFCVGEKVYDNTGGTPDVRWFMVAGGGVVSSAVIHGNPPRGLRASECPHGRPLPSTLDFSVAAADRSGTRTLRATGTGLDVVGFTASPDGASAWRQLGLVDVRDPAVGASARTDPQATPPASGTAVLVAAACLGGDSPTGLIRALRLTGPGRAVPVTLDPGQQGAAAASACRYPSAG